MKNSKRKFELFFKTLTIVSLHLTGDEGLLNLLKKQGYKIKAVQLIKK